MAGIGGCLFRLFGAAEFESGRLRNGRISRERHSQEHLIAYDRRLKMAGRYTGARVEVASRVEDDSVTHLSFRLLWEHAQAMIRCQPFL